METCRSGLLGSTFGMGIVYSPPIPYVAVPKCDISEDQMVVRGLQGEGVVRTPTISWVSKQYKAQWLKHR